MPIVAAKLQKELENRIYNGFKKEFAKDGEGNSKADESWKKQAKIISSIAIDICNMLLTEAQVAPGAAVATTGSPAAQAGTVVSPGKLI